MDDHAKVEKSMETELAVRQGTSFDFILLHSIIYLFIKKLQHWRHSRRMVSCKHQTVPFAVGKKKSVDL